MKIVIALALFVAVAQATLIPRNIDLPLSALNPRHTAAEWEAIYKQQEFTREVVPNYKPGTTPQDDGAGAIREGGVDSQIVGGSVAATGQFPWQVSVTMDSSYFCGGSIISNTWVLTAGHCVDGISSFRLVFGSSTPDGGATGTVALTSRASTLHAQYNGNTIANDIAVIQLPSSLTWTSLIAAVRLPRRSQEGTTFAGLTARVSGWGRTSDSAGGISSVLRWVDLPVITNTVCAATYGTTVRASNICCSGAGGLSTCNGDSGGPLVYQESDGLYTEVGIVSFGSSAGCSLGYPAAFTRVTSYLSWIETNTGIAISP